MPDNPFEKRVQHTLNDFHLVPTDEVWTTVEAGLRKDRRRRVIIFWLPLALLLSAGLGYWILSGEIRKEKPIAQAEQQTSPTHSPAGLDKKESALIPAPSATPDPINPTGVSPQVEKVAEASSPVVAKEEKAISQETSIAALPVQSKNSYWKERSKTVPQKNTSEAVAIIPFLKSEEISQEVMPSLSAKGPRFDWAPASLLERKSISATGTTPLALAATETTHPFSSSPKKGKEKRWSFGLTSGIFVSGITEGGLFSLLQKSAVMDASPVSSGTGNSNTAPPSPSTLKSGLSFSMGGVAKYRVSERLSVLAALQYQQFHTSFAAGLLVNNQTTVSNFRNPNVAVGQYYSAGQSSTYHNRYHFLELPVTLQWKLSKRSPLQWEGGLALGQLLSTNALHFDGTAGIYYADKSLFRRTQFSMHTGLSLLFPKGKYPLELAPQLQYNISSLQQPGGDPAHLWNLGLRVRVYGKR